MAPWGGTKESAVRRPGILPAAWIAAAWLAGSTAASAHIIWHVDDDATPGGNGLTWNTAFPTLQEALARAHDDDQILVAAGRYYPDRGGGQVAGDRDASFRIFDQQLVQGGYRGL